MLCSILVFLALTGQAQEKWDLKKAVDYAVANNISVKQADLQVRISELNYRENKGLQVPTLNFGINAGYNFGLSENPTTGVLQNRQALNTTAGLQSSVTLFNWFSVRNTIAASQISIEAERAQVTKVQNDIAMNVAVAYLQILVAKENENIMMVQVNQTKNQLEVTRKQVAAGSLPELNAAELEAQLATDSSALITARSNTQQLLLQMKALLNLDASLPFDITNPPVELIPVENLAELQPEAVYASALANLPQQKVSVLRIKSAEKQVASARGQLYPNIAAFANLNSRFAYYNVPVYDQVISGYNSTPLRVDAGGGNFYFVQQPVFSQGAKTGNFRSDPIGRQLSDYFGQGIGLSFQVPILNNFRARTAVERARIGVEQLQLQNTLDQQTLKQDIYEAYNNAVAAIEKYNASRKAMEAAEKAFGYAQRRYNLNLLSTYDVLNNQNRLSRARIEMISARYDYVFRVKLLEFYKGQGLKLE